MEAGCRNSNVKGNAAETGLQNGNGRIRQRDDPGLGTRAMWFGQRAELSCNTVRRFSRLLIEAEAFACSRGGFHYFLGCTMVGKKG